MAKVKALGTTIVINSIPIGGLTSIGEVSVSADEIDVTTLDSAAGFKEFLQGLKDSGECVLAGHHIIGDTGQVACRTYFGTGTAYTTVITFSGSTVTFTAWVKAHKIGAADVAGAVGFGATLRITGAVVVAAT